MTNKEKRDAIKAIVYNLPERPSYVWQRHISVSLPKAIWGGVVVKIKIADKYVCFSTTPEWDSVFRETGGDIYKEEIAYFLAIFNNREKILEIYESTCKETF